ncbi:hypothetical protein A5692_23815 [Mycobacterium sp. E342]|nr:hypothetical protein A5692_23815 [Mycobacterium sp. E342]
MTASRSPATDLPKSWDPGAAESAIYQRWLDAGYFEADPTSAKPGYSIVLPPPNVTGSLHMGHALEHTMMDALTRRKRMQGYEVLWQPGMDHAGIATQSVVEKQLAVDGKTKEDFGRELFVEKVWDWKRESGGAIGGQMRRLGDGVAWSRDRFTMDEGLSRAKASPRGWADGFWLVLKPASERAGLSWHDSGGLESPGGVLPPATDATSSSAAPLTRGSVILFSVTLP